MKALTKILIAVALLLFFNACKKSDSPVPLKTYLSKTISSTTGSYTYTYDAQGRMTKENYSNGVTTQAWQSSLNVYDAQNRLVEMVTQSPTAAWPDIKSVMTYNASGKLATYYDYETGTPGHVGYYSFEYTGNTIIRRKYNGDGTINHRIEFVMDAVAANVLEARTYNAAGTLTLTTVYGNFDTQKTPSQLYPVGLYITPASTNNFRTVTQTTASTGAVTTTTFTYDYNADGYPTKRTSSTGATVDYEYFKQ